MVLSLSIPVLIMFVYYFDRHMMIFFVISLFFEISFPLRNQFANIVAYLMIFHFLLNKKSDFFAQENLPKIIRTSGGLLVFAVILSSLNSPHFSWISAYYAFGFIIFITTSYVVFRYSNTTVRIFKLINAFFYSTFFFGTLVIVFIVITKRIRFADISGLAFFDFTPVALLIGLYCYFILGKSNTLIKLATLVVFITLITTLSRNSWIGFTCSFLYGLFLTARFQKSISDFIKSKFFIFILLFLVLFSLFMFTGLGNVITQRVGEVDFDLFSVSDDGRLIKNSLESRILIWIVALNAFLHNPLTGVGYFMFFEVSENYNVLPQLLYDNIVKGLDAHTTFMNFLCETGIIGLSSYIFYLISMIRISYKSIKLSSDLNEQKISIVLHLIVFFISFHSIYAGAFTLGQNAFQMHFFFGLAAANYVILLKKVNTKV